MTYTLVIHFARYGPYHYARLKAAAQELQPIGWQVMGLQTAALDATYAWDTQNLADSAPSLTTAFPNRVHEEITSAECKQGLFPLLTKLQPDAVAIAGWGSNDALTSLSWCRQHRVRSIVMCESREVDGRRVFWKEWIKRLVIRRFDQAIVGGKSHRDYLVKLGMPAERIRFGYNVVDNAYFREQSSSWRVKDHQHYVNNNPYFLASNRFVQRKNLIRLVQAFAAVMSRANLRSSSTHDLCLVGDGPDRAALLSTCDALGLHIVDCAPWEADPVVSSAANGPKVFLPGFRQIDELPRFYAHASCFVHPAISEPWGLVINEAMACGLPVLCSSNCGAAEELVGDGVNGYLFDPLDTEAITRSLQAFLNLSPDVKASMGASSHLRVERLNSLKSFGNGLLELINDPVSAR
jgi:1,2-diacylglycerol 3-alpha-glucosyltransferase